MEEICDVKAYIYLCQNPTQFVTMPRTVLSIMEAGIYLLNPLSLRLVPFLLRTASPQLLRKNVSQFIFTIAIEMGLCAKYLRRLTRNDLI
jgi:hypothetical protein